MAQQSQDHLHLYRMQLSASGMYRPPPPCHDKIPSQHQNQGGCLQVSPSLNSSPAPAEPAEVSLPPVCISPTPSSTPYASGAGRGGKEVPPPRGIAHCSVCKTNRSPEWRKGPSGKKDLCNACGLRFARSRVKKGELPGIRKRAKSTLVGNTRVVQQNHKNSVSDGAVPVSEGPAGGGRAQGSPTPAPLVPISAQQHMFDSVSSTSPPTYQLPTTSAILHPALNTPSPAMYMQDTMSSVVEQDRQMYGAPCAPSMAPIPAAQSRQTAVGRHGGQDNALPERARTSYYPTMAYRTHISSSHMPYSCLSTDSPST